MTKYVLLLGGGQMQVPAIEWSHKLGFGVVCFDGKPDVLGQPLADHFVVCDISNSELCLATARELRAKFDLRGVLTVGTDFSTTVAWVAAGLGLPGIPVEVAQRAKDKGLMRECFAKAGVASPDYQVWTPGEPEFFVPRFGVPCVVKPADSMGARGVQLVTTREELRAALLAAGKHSQSGRVIVEQYIDGPEFSLDAIVEEGHIHRMGLADRHIVFPPYFVEIGHTFPTKMDSSQVEALWTEFEKAIRAVGIERGAAKGDVKLSSKGPMIGEIAARLSGGYMSGWTYPLSSGRSATPWAIEACTGLPLEPQGIDLFRPVAERAWISIPGVVKSLRGLDAVRACEGVAEVFVTLKPGQRMVFPTNNVEKAGNLICTAPSAEGAENLARIARNHLIIELEHPNSETEDFLFGLDSSRWWFEQASRCHPALWWQRAREDHWKDPYGNTIDGLLSVIGWSELNPELRDPRVLRALFKGGLQGLRYEARLRS